MSSLRQHINNFIRDESGPTAVEYAVMLALIIGVCIGSVALFGNAAADMWGSNSGSILEAFDQ